MCSGSPAMKVGQRVARAVYPHTKDVGMGTVTEAPMAAVKGRQRLYTVKWDDGTETKEYSRDLLREYMPTKAEMRRAEAEAEAKR